MENGRVPCPVLPDVAHSVRQVYDLDAGVNKSVGANRIDRDPGNTRWHSYHRFVAEVAYDRDRFVRDRVIEIPFRVHFFARGNKRYIEREQQ